MTDAEMLRLMGQRLVAADARHRRERLDAERVSVAILQDGTAMIVHTTEPRTPQEFLMCVTLTENERRTLAKEKS